MKASLVFLIVAVAVLGGVSAFPAPALKDKGKVEIENISGHHHIKKTMQNQAGDKESRRPSPMTPAQAAHAAALHNASTVVLAHDHVIQAVEFDNALAGGLSGLGLDIVAGDGQEHVDMCRLPRSPIEIFNIYDRNLAQLNAIVAASPHRYRIARTVQDIRDAKIANSLAIIIGTEAADHVVRAITHPPTPADVRAGVRARHLTGWRKSHLFYPPVSEPGAVGCPPPGGRGFGEQSVVLAQTHHADGAGNCTHSRDESGWCLDRRDPPAPEPLLTQLLNGRPNEGHQRNNAPIMNSHDFALASPTPAQHLTICFSILRLRQAAGATESSGTTSFPISLPGVRTTSQPPP